MRKTIKKFFIGTLIAAALCLACGFLEIVSSASYISMIGSGMGVLGDFLYVLDSSIVPICAALTLCGIATIQYVLLHLGKKPAPQKRNSQVPKG